ncbi:hypothetical protein OSB04_017114 [Centaurea solstitialis]|uniref:SWIM-type domain-containing protein n=1 Tax=Centaurea solstitialis TaxID=347529 RepID=A0AA38WKF0_9ASTR|nr:hypothetical protein OSB04_017114 [Centaurea solstitialis]
MFPVTYAVLESENTSSWTWFFESLEKAIGTPTGLVISSDMQKGLEVAITKVYPNVEHRECMRHLYSDFFMLKLWGVVNTYSTSKHDLLLGEIASVRGDAIAYLNENHKKIWSRSKFGTTVKCDYITNNISETFNSWISEFHYKPMLDLLDGIREKLMERFDKKKESTWANFMFVEAVTIEPNCRVWQVKGLPCVHAAAFIAFTRETNWDKYVDPYIRIRHLRAHLKALMKHPPVKGEGEEEIIPKLVKV